jgi:hypothetical protein
MRAVAAQDQCGKIARVTKYGSPYTLVCWREPHQHGQCRDTDNDIWFEPDQEPTA